MSDPPQRHDEDLSTTGSFNLLFVLFGVGLVVLVGWQVWHHASAKRAEPELAPCSEGALSADAGCSPGAR